MAEEDTQQILIRFRGICAHLDLSDDGQGGKMKRTVLVRHRNGDSGIEHHIPYIEFYADDLATFSKSLKVLRYTRPGYDGTFARVDLDDGTEIRLKNVQKGVVREEPSYRKGVLRFKEEILDHLGARLNPIAPRLLVNDPRDIDTTRAMAIFDMPEGTLMGGEPEALITRFERFDSGAEFKARRLARWSDLYATINHGKPIVIELVSLTTGSTRTITFKKDLRMITIGNEPERLILGLLSTTAAAHHGGPHGPNATPIQPTGHFVLYYDLLENSQEERPVPIPTQLGGTGCPNNNYP